MIEIYTDGSSMKSRSGWGFVAVRNGEIIHTESGQESVDKTNQQMELIAAIRGLSWWDNSHYSITGPVTIFSDSAYLINCYIEKWYNTWRNNGWYNSKKEPVANQSLWYCLIPFFDNPKCFFLKVKGHSGHVYNELADKLAQGVVLSVDDLTRDKNDDTINIKLSEILVDYSMKKFPVKETIERIKEVMRGYNG